MSLEKFFMGAEVYALTTQIKEAKQYMAILECHMTPKARELYEAFKGNITREQAHEIMVDSDKLEAASSKFYVNITDIRLALDYLTSKYKLESLEKQKELMQ